MEKTKTGLLSGVLSAAKRALNAIGSNTQLKIGCIILCFILIIVVLTPLLATHDPYALGDELLKPPGKGNLIGTDGLGRDVFSMILYGARTSIMVGLISAAISGVVGTLVGGFAGFFGGRVDGVLSEIINVF